jgi:tRNA G18 (ribose-2'-O)-methylase SpoU
MRQYPITLVLPDIRSAQNVGAILRTADAAGAEIITCGYTPHLAAAGASSADLRPPQVDHRPPHVVDANTKAIAKAALGAELTVPQLHFSDIKEAIRYLKHNQYTVLALEQDESSTNLFDFHPAGSVAIVLGNEVTGLNAEDIALCDGVLELPMIGQKESLNVSIAAGIALYQLRFS